MVGEACGRVRWSLPWCQFEGCVDGGGRLAMSSPKKKNRATMNSDSWPGLGKNGWWGGGSFGRC